MNDIGTMSLPAQTSSQVARVPYERCPLCEVPVSESRSVGQASAVHHPLYRPELPAEMEWLQCSSCSHVFTSGWFDEHASALLMENANPGQVLSDSTQSVRAIAARVVTTVSNLRGALDGTWLDVGCGDGALVATAHEFGYESMGIDLRKEPVQALSRLGYSARQSDLESLPEGTKWDVISIANALEHMPFPRPVVEAARDRLAPGGVLFVSTPNMDSLTWRVMDRDHRNPFWSEIEHYHNFDRARLYALLATSDLRPCYFSVGERYLAAMEVCAVKDAS